MKNYDCIVQALQDTVWCIHPPKLQEIIAVMDARLSGTTTAAIDLEAIKARREEHLGVRGSTAVLGLHGTISPKVGLLSGSGGTNLQEFQAAFKAAISDGAISALVVDVDSPGGSVFSLRETADMIHSARGLKPMTAVINPEGYSAAYYLASQFDDIAITPSGMVGSVGTMTAHINRTKANEKAGLDVEYIYAGKHKVEGNPDQPLTDEARAEKQRLVNHYYADFLSAVARGRGVSTQTVEATFGQGRVFTAHDALQRGMVSRIATLEQVISEQASSSHLSGSRRTAERLRMKMGLTTRQIHS